MARLGKVDPRGCGGAPESKLRVLLLKGRSPRVRGSLARIGQRGGLHGSIPAGAGEPRSPNCSHHSVRVDPRGCGGAPGGDIGRALVKGRSPRVRGSLHASFLRMRWTGSIPAGAGEPACPRAPRFQRGVDPRGCGGAVAVRNNGPAVQGRSPRVRGSLARPPQLAHSQGSIPAGAGEPIVVHYFRHASRVDPRECGGATWWALGDSIIWGRSPRVRGSRGAGRARPHGPGSIPAGAGEPPAWNS